jgi:TolB-like protein/tetratricopeptide (TPR) repeat protein
LTVQRWFNELRRRKVFRVVGVYAVGAWAVVQVVATTFPLLHLPEWTTLLVLVMALVGFPFALLLAWFFDLTPQGVVRTAAETEVSGAVAAPAGPAATVAPAVPGRSVHGRAAGFFGLGMLVALVTVAAYFRFGPTPGASSIDSIAVLPFVDLSPGRDQEYFSDGMTEELLDRFAHVEGLLVAARTSSFAFKGVNEDVEAIGRKLGVRSVLEGSIRREGDQLRVTAQLIDARTGYHLWSQTYDREVSSVFAIQDEIANEIVRELSKQFTPPEIQPQRRPTSVRAHDLYLQALARWNFRTDANVRQAITLFEQAVKEDPAYAPAFAGLAQAYAVLPSLGSFPVREAILKGTAAAAQALALDAGLADAHAALGQIAQGFEWDLASAERAYRRALTFNSAYATAHQWYAETLVMLGRADEAREHVERALELDPLSPAAMAVQAYVLAVRGDYAAALAGYENVTTLYPDYSLAEINRVLLAVYLRKPEDAAPAALAAAGGDTAAATAIRSVAALRAGGSSPLSQSAALARLDAVHAPALAALWHAALGDNEGALRLLESAVAQRSDPNVPFILIHPLLEPLRAEPRFRTLTETVGVVPPGR